MLVTPASNRRNRHFALGLAAVAAVAVAAISFSLPWCLPALLLGPIIYWLVRRPCLRRLRVMAHPFPPVWEGILSSRVVYFNALNEQQQNRFRQLTKVFLDETRITGIRTDVDETTRVLVAASAIIPMFNFDDWEYARLGEVLIYPGSFDDNYRTDGDQPADTLGMVGAGYLSGVMILSKPALLSGFDITTDKNNVGIHEFAHLIDGADGAIDGIPPGVPAEVARSWIEWVDRELAEPPEQRCHIKDYAYTNEAEYFAVLVEYFFEAPAILQQKNPRLYSMLAKMFRQDTAIFLPGVTRRQRPRIGRNSQCPCGSGKKFKKCCLRSAAQGMPN
jgi:MtfA peptidase